MTRRRVLLSIVAAALSAPAALPAQAPDSAVPGAALRVSRGVVPESVTVGDRFRSFVALHAPPGARVSFRGVPSSDSIQAFDSVRAILRADGTPVGIYSVVAWVAGAPLSTEVAVQVLVPGTPERSYRVPLRLPLVRSVLPAEGEVAPRPAKGLLRSIEPGRSRLWWAVIAAALLALVLAAWLTWRRGRRSPAPLEPRAVALEQLDGLLATGIPPAVPEGPFYAAATRVLREYLARTDADLGEHLTSAELISELRRASTGSSDVPGLERILQHADRVKFARLTPAGGEAKRFFEDLRAWIASSPTSAAQREEAA